jgi:hypothetical protein
MTNPPLHDFYRHWEFWFGWDVTYGEMRKAANDV